MLPRRQARWMAVLRFGATCRFEVHPEQLPPIHGTHPGAGGPDVLRGMPWT